MLDYTYIKFQEFTEFIEKMDFRLILEKHADIENNVGFFLYEICEETILKFAERESDCFILHDKTTIRLDFDLNNVERKIIFFVLNPIDIKRKKKTKSISLFGGISRIEIEYWHRVDQLAETVLMKLIEFLKLAYTYLEETYIRRFSEWN